eukprot:gene738-7466_t
MSSDDDDFLSDNNMYPSPEKAPRHNGDGHYGAPAAVADPATGQTDTQTPKPPTMQNAFVKEVKTLLQTPRTPGGIINADADGENPSGAATTPDMQQTCSSSSSSGNAAKSSNDGACSGCEGGEPIDANGKRRSAINASINSNTENASSSNGNGNGNEEEDEEMRRQEHDDAGAGNGPDQPAPVVCMDVVQYDPVDLDIALPETQPTHQAQPTGSSLPPSRISELALTTGDGVVAAAAPVAMAAVAGAGVESVDTGTRTPSASLGMANFLEKEAAAAFPSSPMSASDSADPALSDSNGTSKRRRVLARETDGDGDVSSEARHSSKCVQAKTATGAAEAAGGLGPVNDSSLPERTPPIAVQSRPRRAVNSARSPNTDADSTFSRTIVSTDASDEDVDEDSAFARIGSSKTGAAARRASSKRKALAAKSAKIRVSGSGAQEADTARARRALTPAWTAEADSILVRAYAKVSKNQKEKFISWQAVAEILAEGGRPGTTDSAARSRWGYVLKTHSATMVKGTAVLDRVAALIKTHALPPLAKKVKFKGPTTRGKLTTNMMNIKKHIRWDAVPALLEDVRTGSSKVEAKQRWNELVSMQKQLMSTGRKANQKAFEEGWTSDTKAHPLIGKRIARQFLNAAEATYGNIVASLSPDASGENEWYFVHWMDDGDMEELEVYEIEAGVELLKTLEEGKRKKARTAAAAATKAARKETRAKGKRKVSADVDVAVATLESEPKGKKLKGARKQSKKKSAGAASTDTAAVAAVPTTGSASSKAKAKAKTTTGYQFCFKHGGKPDNDLVHHMPLKVSKSGGERKKMDKGKGKGKVFIAGGAGAATAALAPSGVGGGVGRSGGGEPKGGSTATRPATPPPLPTPPRARLSAIYKKPSNTVIIIGAGIAGLSAMNHILDKDEHVNVIVLEARERNGGRINTVYLNQADGRKAACNIGANFVHGCDSDGGNFVFNKYTGSKIAGLVDAEYGVERWLDENARVEKMKDLYTAVDEEMLKLATEAKAAGEANRSIEEEFVKMLEKLSFFDIVDTFDAGSLEGGDKMALGGYAELVEYYVKKWEGRQIIVNQAVVENVQWKEGECIVGYRKKKSSSGSKSVRRLVQMHAHSVICTLPLGVLQEKKDLFTPPLPEPKLNAINKLKMGLENRVLLRFEKCFWPETDHFLRSLVAPHFKILNLHAYGDHDNILMLFVPPPDSDLMESMTDEQIKLWALNDLKKIFNKGKKLPALLEYRITRWRSGEE